MAGALRVNESASRSAEQPEKALVDVAAVFLIYLRLVFSKHYMMGKVVAFQCCKLTQASLGRIGCKRRDRFCGERYGLVLFSSGIY